LLERLSDSPTWVIVLAALGGLIFTVLAFILQGRPELSKHHRRRELICGVGVVLGLGWTLLAGHTLWGRFQAQADFSAEGSAPEAAKPSVGLLRIEDAGRERSTTDVEDAAELKVLESASFPEPIDAGGAEADWPQWRGPRRDGISLAAGLRTDWNPVPPVLWTRPFGGGYSSCAIAGGLLYTMDKKDKEEGIHCLDAQTGKSLWSYRYSVDYKFRSKAEGPRSTPTVVDGLVYTLGATGVLLCLEAVSRDNEPHILWRHDLVAEYQANLYHWGLACCPLVEGNLVIVQAGGKDASILAFDRKTGSLMWKVLSDPAGYSSPMAATVAGVRQIIALTGNRLVGLRPTDGSLLWQYAWTTFGGTNCATPIVTGNYVFISAEYRMGCALIHIVSDKDGSLRAAPVYVKANKVLHNYRSSCVLHRGHLYGFDVPSIRAGVFKCVNVRTGAEAWSVRKPATGSLLLSGDRLFILTEDGELIIARADPEKFKQETSIPGILSGYDCYASPALAGGKLYLRDHHQIVCVDLRPILQ
jgi:outer membrane protein assembly factor BamB